MNIPLTIAHRFQKNCIIRKLFNNFNRFRVLLSINWPKEFIDLPHKRHNWEVRMIYLISIGIITTTLLTFRLINPWNKFKYL